MKDILIVVSPSNNDNHPVYIELRTEAQKYGKEAQQILYTSYLLTGPRSFENAMSIVRIADQHNFDVAIFEIESVLKVPRAKAEQGIPTLS
jgi:hypothetical protein